MSLVDYDALLDVTYGMQGIAATFLSRDGLNVELVVMDKSDGVELPGGVLTEALRPAVTVRGSELIAKKIDAKRLRDGRLTFNDVAWNVQATRPKPKPNGSGEFYLFLEVRNHG